MTNKEFLKELKKRVRKYAGVKCKDFHYACFACEAWVAYEIIADMLEEGGETFDEHLQGIKEDK